MDRFFSELFSPNFMPHGHCYFWNPFVLWLNVGADFFIAASYYSIPLALIYFVHKREDLIFDKIFVMFAIFILACGTTHLVEIWNVWNGDYAIAGLVKLVTAIASIITAIALWKLMPKALKIPSVSTLEASNRRLEEEIQVRKKAEQEVKDLNSSLSLRVAEATKNEREARARAEKESVLKDEFLATLSHELRTPLNSILGWTQMLKASPTREELEKGLSVIERNSRIQTKLIEDLLDMSRIISGKFSLETRETNVAMALEMAISSVRISAEAKRVNLTHSIAPESGTIMGDPARLQQIFWNLLSNSIKFTPQGGSVQVALTSTDALIEVTVRDTGIGIGRDFLPHVFERFRQEDATITRSNLGLGIGLSITKQLVELHGGSITVSSEGPGKGAVFSVFFPKHLSSEADSPEPTVGRTSIVRPPQITKDYLQNIKVLVVDDHAESREIAKVILSAHGAQVTLASSAEEALAKLEVERFSLLISDIGMPHQDGYSLLRNLRASPHSKSRNVPAVALTAFAQAEDRVRAGLAGFHTHLTKPIEPIELLMIVKALSSAEGASDS